MPPLGARERRHRSLDFTHIDHVDRDQIGGLMAYFFESTDINRHLADQLDLILKGVKLGDIPIWQPTKFLLSVNLKAAKALALTVPVSLLATADEVIE
jgi:putative tryptophan/tyrosine transport system substrate-binding protein